MVENVMGKGLLVERALQSMYKKYALESWISAIGKRDGKTPDEIIFCQKMWFCQNVLPSENF